MNRRVYMLVTNARRRGCLSVRTMLALSFLVGAMLPERSPAQTFNDVPTDYWAYEFIETLAWNGITLGCGGGDFCPENPITRAQMAVFLERGIRGSSYVPPPATGNIFFDVGALDFAAGFIEQLFLDGITTGCGFSIFCPSDPVTRAQMAVFLLRAKYGASYSPPTNYTPGFGDVGPGDFAAAWIYQLSAEGITGGCGGGNYCPNQLVTRAQMAVFFVRTFNYPIRLPPEPLIWDQGKWDHDNWQ